MTYNESARIVPGSALADILRARAPEAIVPEDYARVQLLERDQMHRMVFKAHDRSYIVYGSMSKDFPICSDFSDFCRDDVKKYALRVGLAVRPAFGTLYYTKNAVDTEGPWIGKHKRHAINWAVYADGTIEFREPQSDKWMDTPEDCRSMDEFKL